MKRAVLYLRVSTQDQTTANQEREVREIAGRMGCDVVKVYNARAKEDTPATRVFQDYEHMNLSFQSTY